jgi:hypothetical protein
MFWHLHQQQKFMLDTDSLPTGARHTCSFLHLISHWRKAHMLIFALDFALAQHA